MPLRKSTEFEFLITEPAEIEIFDAIEWYKKIDERLAKRFVFELYDYFDLIKKKPNSFRVRYKKLRLANLPIFPYQIIYRLKSNSIEVIAVIHAKRNPKHWKRKK